MKPRLIASPQRPKARGSVSGGWSSLARSPVQVQPFNTRRSWPARVRATPK